MKRITLAVGSVMALFLLTVGSQKALADVVTTLYCVAGTSVGCATTPEAPGTYWTVTNDLATTATTFTDTFSVAGPGSYLTAFSITEFSGSVSGTSLALSDTYGWTDVEASKTNGGAGTCTGNDTKAFCVSDANGGSLLLLSSTARTFTITGSYTGSVVSPITLQLFSATNSDGTGGNVLAISQSAFGTSVPDGGMTVMLLGGALVGLEALRRRVRA